MDEFLIHSERNTCPGDSANIATLASPPTIDPNQTSQLRPRAGNRNSERGDMWRADLASQQEYVGGGCYSVEFHTQTGKYKHKLKLFNFTEKTGQKCNRINL